MSTQSKIVDGEEFCKKLFCTSLEKLYPLRITQEKGVEIHRRCPSVTLCFFDAELSDTSAPTVISLVCKVFYACTEPSVLEGIVETMNHAHRHNVNCPRPIKTKDGTLIGRVEKESFPLSFSFTDILDARNFSPLSEKEVDLPKKKKNRPSIIDCYYVYVMTRLPGQLFSDMEGRLRTDAMRWCFGYATGNLSRKLSTLSIDAIKRRMYDYDLKFFPNMKRHLTSPAVRDPKLQKHFNKAFRDFEMHVAPRIDTLTSGICHNDCIPSNFLFSDNTLVVDYNKREHLDGGELDEIRLPGVIDFDDVRYGPYLFDLGAAVAHEMAVTWKSTDGDFLPAASPVMDGFLTALPLPDEELDLLGYVIPSRLVQVYIGLRVNVKESCDCSRPSICPYIEFAEGIKEFLAIYFSNDEKTIRKSLQYRTQL